MEYRRRTVAGNDWGVRSRQRGARRLSCPNGVDQPDYDYDDDDSVNNNNNNSGSVSAAANANDTTALVDELEQLRTDNFQLRLRVYNAERRVDRLSASAARCRDDGSDSSDAGSSSASDDDDDDARALAAAKATAGAAVRTVHDLLTVNRRLLALLAAAVSAKAVAVTADDKRRWQKLRHCVDNCGAGAPQIEEVEKANDNGDGSATSEEETETRITAQKLDASEGRATKATARHVRLRSPPPPSPPPPPPPPEPDALKDNDDDDAGSSELVRLRARCRRLERSLQQLVNTELWARNRQIGKLEQQRYVTQVQEAQKERRSAAVAPQQSVTVPVQPVCTKGILVKKSPPPPSPPVKEPVLPDYSEVNFFYSCDEDDDDDDDEDNDDDDRENDSETNALSSTEEETQSGNEPVKLSATIAAVGGAPLASSSPQVVGSQKRQRRRRRPKNDAARTAEVSSSTESLSVAVQGDSTDAASSSRRGHRVAGLRRRRRCGGPQRRGSTCGRCAGDPETADAQVQCDGTGAGDGDDQAGLLRRELEARRRENCRLYDMLLRLQRDRGSNVGRPEDRVACSSSDRDDDGSPEPYGRAARAVRGRIADLLPPLLRPSAARPTACNGSAAVRTDRDEDEQTAVLRLQQQQQLLLLARLRERIVAYERQELLGGGGDRVDAASPTEDRDNAVEHMDRASLVNVALPRAVDRLRRALVPLMQHNKRQQKRSPSPPMETVRAAAERDSSVG